MYGFFTGYRFVDTEKFLGWWRGPVQLQTSGDPINFTIAKKPFFRKTVGGGDWTPCTPSGSPMLYKYMYKIKHDQSIKHANFVFKNMQHDFCKFSSSFVVQNGIKKDRTFE